ncbi:MAG: hypothetical protein MZW92_13400 [Comamonadaceae bacterium]|nr:hypothetical protein [Comamonadaceae bacterium]
MTEATPCRDPHRAPPAACTITVSGEITAPRSAHAGRHPAPHRLGEDAAAGALRQRRRRCARGHGAGPRAAGGGSARLRAAAPALLQRLCAGAGGSGSTRAAHGRVGIHRPQPVAAPALFPAGVPKRDDSAREIRGYLAEMQVERGALRRNGQGAAEGHADSHPIGASGLRAAAGRAAAGGAGVDGKVGQESNFADDRAGSASPRRKRRVAGTVEVHRLPAALPSPGKTRAGARPARSRDRNGIAGCRGSASPWPAYPRLPDACLPCETLRPPPAASSLPMPGLRSVAGSCPGRRRSSSCPWDNGRRRPRR